MFEGHFPHPVFTFSRSEFAVSAAVQFLRVATDDLFGSFHLDDRVHPEKPLLVALHPVIVLLIDFVDIREIVYHDSYDLADVFMARETMKAVSLAAESPFPASQWLCYEIAREGVSLFPAPGNNYLTVRRARDQLEWPVLTSIPWRC